MNSKVIDDVYTYNIPIFKYLYQRQYQISPTSDPDPMLQLCTQLLPAMLTDIFPFWQL